jgi:hypothetical protein
MERGAWILVTLFVAALGQPRDCWAQDIAVRLIDARNGNIVANETVSLRFHVGEGANSHQETLEATTGTDGVARFRLPEPPPSTFSLSPNHLYLCANLFCGVYPYQEDTQQVVHDGCISSCSKTGRGCRCKFGKWASQLRPTPGEVVLLVRPITAWERFWWRFLE